MRLLFFLIVFSFNSVAADCHVFKVRGSVEFHDGEFLLVVNKKTRSEYRFKIKEKSKMKILPFIEDYVEAELIFPKREVSKKGSIQEIKSIKSWVPDPLFNKESFSYIEKREACSKD